MKNDICHGFSKSTRFSITFCMEFGSFFVVFFIAFFGRAFSKKCRCCKVRHARIVWFLQWILTNSTFHVFLAKAKKTENLARNSMQKTYQIPDRIASKIRCQKSWNFIQNPWKLPPGPVFLAISLPLATFSCHEARCRGPMPRGNGHEAARGTWQAARGTWQVARGPWQVARCLQPSPSPPWQRLLDIVADM